MTPSFRIWLPIIIGGTVVVAIVVGGIITKFVFKKKPKTTLQGQSIKISTRFIDREVINHDSYLYTFALPSPDHILGLPVGNYVRLHARINGENVVRPYTPISLENEKGYVKFCIKTYRKNVNQTFPAGGKMTQFLEGLTKDSCLDISGPCGEIFYMGNGHFDIKGAKPRKINVQRISLICGGSGLTPIYQLIRAILESENDNTKITLLFANHTESDILLRDQLESLRDKNVNQFRLWYTLSNAPQHWPYSVGYIDSQMLEQHIFPPDEDTIALLCGPSPMIKSACIPNLKALGYNDDMYIAF